MGRGKKHYPKHKMRSILSNSGNVEIAVLERPAPTIDEKQKILIYCEGENTEPSYFRKFRLSTAVVEAFGQGRNTKSLVERAIELKMKGDYDQVWCVFDGDDNSIQNFNEAVWLAEKNGFGIAYSIQAFEYWLILHFEDHQGGEMPRDDYNAKLNSYINPLGAHYEGKGNKLISDDFFDLLDSFDDITKRPRIELAIKRAKRNYARFDPHVSPGKEESSTTVFRLVEEIQKYL